MNTQTAAKTAELFINRTLDAPRDLVFKAWTEQTRHARSPHSSQIRGGIARIWPVWPQTGRR